MSLPYFILIACAMFLMACVDDDDKGVSNVRPGTYRLHQDYQVRVCAKADSACQIIDVESFWDIDSARVKYRTYLNDFLWCRGGGPYQQHDDRLVIYNPADTCTVRNDDDVLVQDSLYTYEQDSTRYYLENVKTNSFRMKQSINSPWVSYTREYE